ERTGGAHPDRPRRGPGGVQPRLHGGPPRGRWLPAAGRPWGPCPHGSGALGEGLAAVRNEAREVRVGVISDTHGLLRPEAIHALRGASVIVHAGDIGGREI